MSLSQPFINWPVATSLLMLGLVLVGVVAFELLPVAPLPQVDFPTIRIDADLPGASADTMASSVATPLERSLSDISGIASMTSSSSLGTTSITVQFDLTRNSDAAAQDVQTAINAAGGKLPKNLPSPPTYHKVNPADFTILSLALTSDTLPLPEIDRYADDFIATQISQVAGVGLVDFHGEQKPAVRVRINPDKIAQLGLSLEDVRTVLGAATVNGPKGNLDGPQRAVVLDATDEVFNADAYKNLVVEYKNGAPIRVADIGTAVDAAEDAKEAAWLQDKRTIIIDIHKQPGFNVVETIRRIKERLPALTALLPPSVKLIVAGDRTQTIEASVHDVQATLAITVCLVVLVIFLFLRNFWATVIPGIAIPLSLIATFGIMYLLGYSLDNLSLMGLTISSGLCRRRRDRRDREHSPACRARCPAATSGARRCARGRLHSRVDDHLVDRGLHPRAVHERHHWPIVPRVRNHGQRRHCHVGANLADRHTDDVREADPASPARGARTRFPGMRRRFRLDVALL